MTTLVEEAGAFYQTQLQRYAEAAEYLRQRSRHDPELIAELGIGYAPGGNLRRHLAGLGYSFDLLLRKGLINEQGRDAFCRRAIFPCLSRAARSISTAAVSERLSHTACCRARRGLVYVGVGQCLLLRHPRGGSI